MEKLAFIFSKNKIAIAVIALIFIAAYCSVGYHQADEHFQILEYAALKLHLTQPSLLPWEYQFQMRPALQPAIVVCIYNVVEFLFGSNPFLVNFLLRLLSGILSFSGLFLLYKIHKNEFSNQKILAKYFLLSSFFLWFYFYCGVRFSSENWSASFFVLGYCSYFLTGKKKWLQAFLVGALLGLSVVCRTQSAAMVAGFGLWLLLVKKEKIQWLLAIVICFFLLYGFGMLIDKWFYGKWVFTAYNYYHQNITLHKAALGAGSNPWWFYFSYFFITGVPPISLVIIITALSFFALFPWNAVTWIVFPFVLSHIILAHKELRFLFPIIVFIPFMFTKSVQKVDVFFSLLKSKLFRRSMAFVWFINLAVLAIVVVKPLNIHDSLYHFMFKNYADKTILYCRTADDNPYKKVGLDVNFFKRKNLEIKVISSLNEAVAVPTTNCFFVTEHKKQFADSLQNKKMIYCTFPNWVWKFNFNNWLERTDCYYLYQLN